MYSTGAKKLTGLGLVNYSFYPNSLFQKIDVGISGSTFTVEQFTNSDNNKSNLGFTKVVPGIRLTLNEKDPRSQRHRFIQFKSYLFKEDALQFYRDTVIVGLDTTITFKNRTVTDSRTLNQLRFVVENNRVLYP